MCFFKRWQWFGSSNGVIWWLIIFVIQCLQAQGRIFESSKDGTSFSKNPGDTLKPKERIHSFNHQISVEYHPAWVIPSDPFYKSDNSVKFSPGFAHSEHLKYAFSLPKNTLGSQIFPQTFQGVGIALFDFGNKKEIGKPVAIYLFQRSRIARISPRFSMDYEWNFGLSGAWAPYNPDSNPNNIVVGSRMNAYINLGVSVMWQVAERVAMTGGVDFTHFSNGNTEYPNAGVNLPGVRLGMTYNISKTDAQRYRAEQVQPPEFHKYLSYDLIAFGSWRRKGVDFFGTQVASPYKYSVAGAYFAPMYNWSYRLRTGISLDALYDGSANVYAPDYIAGTEQPFIKPSWDRQVGLGLSGRVDYVMPLFTIGAGIGTYFLHNGGDMKGTYQALVLKVRVTRNSFVHIGYNIKDFTDPNYLMLGLGYRFNNGAPALLSK